MKEPAYVEQGAFFGPCDPSLERNGDVTASEGYRYRLWRVWDQRLPRVAFFMLNPSTATAEKLDPTLRRCLGFAMAWGCGAFEVGNLYALRATDPGLLRQDGDVIGPDNDLHLEAIAEDATFGVVAAWGANAEPARADHVLDILARRASRALRLGALTLGGHPRHPLYLPAATPLVPHLRSAA